MSDLSWADDVPELRRAIVDERALNAALPSAPADLRERILDRAARGVGPSVSFGAALSPWLVALVSVVVGIGLGAGGFALMAGAGDGVRERPPAAAVVVDAAPSPVAARRGEASPAPASPPAAAAPSSPPPAATTPVATPSAATTPVATPSAATRSAARPRASTRRENLAAELRTFERAEAARAEGRSAAALAEYEAYLRAWPRGSLSGEAGIGAAALALQLGRPVQALAHLDALPLDELPRPLAAESARLRVATLLALGRCRDAAVAAEQPEGAPWRATVAERCP